MTSTLQKIRMGASLYEVLIKSMRLNGRGLVRTQKISVLIVSILLMSCDSDDVRSNHKEAINRLEYHYLVHYAHVPGSKKCLNPRQLGIQWFTLCGVNIHQDGTNHLSAGIWEIKEEENGGWAVYAYDIKAAKSQILFIDDPQIRPPLPLSKNATSAHARSIFMHD